MIQIVDGDYCMIDGNYRHVVYTDDKGIKIVLLNIIKDSKAQSIFELMYKGKLISTHSTIYKLSMAIKELNH